ncbi:MAG: hypothetical protein KBC12_03105 [Candidatus Pacebacteria bacterium]|nr:hypothetical protein [Candidatus Paceibacterota bacterium]
MKKTVFLWILRYLLIPVGFIWATGIIDGIIAIENADRQADPWRGFSAEELATLQITPDNLRAFGDSLSKERKRHIKETGFYEPFLYFGDLKQFSMFEAVFQDSLDKTHEGRSKILFFNNMKNNLVGLRSDNWRRFENLEKATTDSIEGSMSITEAQHFWFPKVAKEDALRAKEPPVQLWSDVSVPFLLWFFGFYLKGMPFAFILFLIWRFRFRAEVDDLYWEEAERPVLDTNYKPLSFVLCLLVWPILVYLNLRNQWSESMRKADVLSRRQDMLSLLSEQDKKLLDLGRRMSLREFRTFLDELEMQRKHSFVSALFVVLFFVSIQRIFPHQSQQLFGYNTVTHIEVSSGDTDVGWSYLLADHLDDFVILPSVGWSEKVLRIKNIFSSNAVKAIPGFVRLLEGVPKVSKSFAFELIS